MKFTVTSDNLSVRLQTINKVQSSKNALNILECILFEVKGSTLRMIASDSENLMSSTLEISEVEGEGRFAIPARQIISSIKELSDQPITFEVNTETMAIEICYQNGKYNLIGQNADDYPIIQGVGAASQSVMIAPDVMLDGIGHCLFAVASDTLRPQMNGVFFDMTPEGITFVASDGHKLVRDAFGKACAPEASSFILPAKPALMLKNVLGKVDGDVEMRFSSNNAEFRMPDYYLCCRLIEGRFPDYNSVIPRDNPFRVVVDRLAFISALRRVLVFASQSNSLVKIHVNQGTMTVSAQDLDFSTSAVENVICDYDGTAMSIGFSGQYLLEVLNSMVCDDVALELADPSRAGIITPAAQEDGEDLLMLLMPMMLKD